MADVKKYLSLDKLTKYDTKIKGVISAGDEATLDSAKAYADGLASNYDGAGSAATAEANAKTYTDAEVKKLADGAVATAQAAAEAADAKAVAADGKAVAAQAAADKAQEEVDALELVVQNIQENAYDDTELVEAIEGLEANKADKTQVATDIAAAKTELEGKISAKADQTALDEVAGIANAAATKVALEAEVERAKGEEARIEGLVSAEAERAAAAEGALETRIETMEVFWDTTEDSDGVVNKLKEIQKYIADDETGAAAMAGSIQDNAEAISEMDKAYKAADATLQGNIDTLAGTVSTKAAQDDLEALEERVEAVEGGVEENAEAIAALEAKFGEGEGSVADMIADAVAAEKAEREAADAEVQADADKGIADAAAALAAAQEADRKAVAAQGEVDALELVVDTKAAASDVTTLQGKVGTLESDMTQAKADIDAVEALAAANASAIEALQAASATHATKTALEEEVARAKAAEEANKAAIEAFVEISEEEVNQLFA